MNGASIGVIARLFAVVVLIIIFLVKGKHTFYKGKHEITIIEEESQEIDSIEEK